MANIHAMSEPRDDGPQYRQQPHNIPVEQALLGAILVNNKALDRVVGFLTPEHFFEPAHGRIYRAMQHRIGQDKLASPVTLFATFREDDGLAEVGGGQYLARLAASVVSVVDAEDYGRVIHDLALRRQLIAVGEELVNRAYNDAIEMSAVEQIQDVTARLDQLGSGSTSNHATDLYSAAMEAQQLSFDIVNQNGEVPLSTGFVDLDRLLAGGFRRASYLLLAGRPSMGKSAFALSIIRKVAEQKERPRVGLVGLEMSNIQNAERALGSIADVPYVEIMQGEEKAADAAARALPPYREAWRNVWMNDAGGQTIEQLRATLIIEHRRNPFRLIVIDQLDLVEPSRHTLSWPRVYQLKHISNTLLAMCKSFNIPFLVLHQLSRAVENRDDKRPHLADLRDSGSLEQDAHIVMFIYRHHYYLHREGSPTKAGYDAWVSECLDCEKEADILVPKNRMGRTGEIKVYANLPTNKFGNAAFTGGYGSATD